MENKSKKISINGNKNKNLSCRMTPCRITGCRIEFFLILTPPTGGGVGSERDPTLTLPYPLKSLA